VQHKKQPPKNLISPKRYNLNYVNLHHFISRDTKYYYSEHFVNITEVIAVYTKQ